MKKRILVLGASGFIGKRLVHMLAASDWAHPVAASRSSRTEKPSMAGQVEGLQLDATKAGDMNHALAGVDAVVNCVAGGANTIVEGARVLFEAAAALPNRPRIVHLSTMAVYGGVVGDVDETASIGADLSAYGAAKLSAERFAADYGAAVILRPGIVYGPGSSQWSTRIARLLISHRLGDLGNRGDGICNLVYVDDVVQAIISSIRSPAAAGKVFNLAMPRPPTWNEYFTLYARALGAVPVARVTARRFKIETKILAIPLKIAEIAAGKLGASVGRMVPPPIPPSLAHLFQQEVRLIVDAAESGLGMRWTPFSEALAGTAAWYLESHR
jgi:nucleoside-diphosphate-sugar epimerase